MYYSVELAWEPKIIGVKNGIYQVELDKTAYTKDTYGQIDSLFISNIIAENQQTPAIDFIFYFKKLKSAKKTSFMSFSPYLSQCHFLIQKNVLEIFKYFKIQDHIAFEAEIYDSYKEDHDTNYRLFYMAHQDWDVVDFEGTVFTSGGFGNNPEIEYKFMDEKEMREFNGITKVKTLSLTTKFDFSLDFFHTRLGGIFISEKLKSALEDKSFTGIKFKKEVEVLR